MPSSPKHRHPRRKARTPAEAARMRVKSENRWGSDAQALTSGRVAMAPHRWWHDARSDSRSDPISVR